LPDFRCQKGSFWPLAKSLMYFLISVTAEVNSESGSSMSKVHQSCTSESLNARDCTEGEPGNEYSGENIVNGPDADGFLCSRRRLGSG